MSASTNLHGASAARTLHHINRKPDECHSYACLIIEARDGCEVVIFGPPSAMGAFDRAAAIIHDALRPVDVQEAAE